MAASLRGGWRLRGGWQSTGDGSVRRGMAAARRGSPAPKTSWGRFRSPHNSRRASTAREPAGGRVSPPASGSGRRATGAPSMRAVRAAPPLWRRVFPGRRQGRGIPVRATAARSTAASWSAARQESGPGQRWPPARWLATFAGESVAIPRRAPLPTQCDRAVQRPGGHAHNAAALTNPGGHGIASRAVDEARRAGAARHSCSTPRPGCTSGHPPPGPDCGHQWTTKHLALPPDPAHDGGGAPHRHQHDDPTTDRRSTGPPRRTPTAGAAATGPTTPPGPSRLRCPGPFHEGQWVGESPGRGVIVHADRRRSAGPVEGRAAGRTGATADPIFLAAQTRSASVYRSRSRLARLSGRRKLSRRQLHAGHQWIDPAAHPARATCSGRRPDHRCGQEQSRMRVDVGSGHVRNPKRRRHH